MSSKAPDEQLKEFRTSKPAYLMRVLEGVPTEKDLDALIEGKYRDYQLFREAEREYESILKRIPHGSRDRDKQRAQAMAKVLVTPSPRGRPRKDELIAQEICELRTAKWGWAEIANEINTKHGSETTTEEAARGLFATYRTKFARPRKTSEEQLAEFEVSYPDWLIRIFNMGYSYSEADSNPDWDSDSGSDFQRWRKSEFRDLRVLKSAQDEYERILKQIPSKWREYKKKKKRNVHTILVPPGRPGKPRDDEEAEKLRERLRTTSPEQTARENLRDNPEFKKARARGKRLLLKKEQDRIRKRIS